MKRRQFTKEFKIQVAKEAMEVGNQALVARRYDLGSNLLNRWVREYKDGHYGDVPIESAQPREFSDLAQENDQLKRLLGEKDLEIAILRDLVKKQHPHLLKRLK
ncbi:transposase [Numidum massiliense]|uniref:transposase n=1 Tax=Numidum massiliense TaxID=1522315 RepID=UPI0006D5616E|nr:transposase [Numidum massiliense]